MKKTLVIVTAALLMFPLLTMAQQTGTASVNESSPVERLYFEGAFGASTKSHQITPEVVQFNIGYTFPCKVFTFARAEYVMGMMDNGNENYSLCYKAADLGLGVGYKLYSTPKVSRYWPFSDVGVHAFAGTTVGGMDWSYNTFEVALNLGIRKHSTTTYTVGYRYYDSRTTGISNLSGMFFSLGLRL